VKVEGEDDDAELLHSRMQKQEAEIALLGDQKVELQSKLSSLEAKVSSSVSSL
jgi:hypothetical protein